ncbi:MAG: hypothetical protein ACP5QA_10470 [Phycisphaerae bacterium]
MNDKQFTFFAVVVALVFLALYLWKKHTTQAVTPSMGGAFPENPNWPMESVSPETFSPPTIGNLSLNVQNPGFNLLSNQYIPLFGFVGMAQGNRWA